MKKESKESRVGGGARERIVMLRLGGQITCHLHVGVDAAAGLQIFPGCCLILLKALSEDHWVVDEAGNTDRDRLFGELQACGSFWTTFAGLYEGVLLDKVQPSGAPNKALVLTDADYTAAREWTGANGVDDVEKPTAAQWKRWYALERPAEEEEGGVAERKYTAPPRNSALPKGDEAEDFGGGSGVKRGPESSSSESTPYTKRFAAGAAAAAFAPASELLFIPPGLCKENGEVRLFMNAGRHVGSFPKLTILVRAKITGADMTKLRGFATGDEPVELIKTTPEGVSVGTWAWAMTPTTAAKMLNAWVTRGDIKFKCEEGVKAFIRANSATALSVLFDEEGAAEA